MVVCVVNMSPAVREGWRVPLPEGGAWRELLNTDAERYWGTNVGNLGAVHADGPALHGRPCSAQVTLPPLAAVWLAPTRQAG